MCAGSLTELLSDYAESDRPLLSSNKMHNSSTLYQAGSEKNELSSSVCVCVCGTGGTLIPVPR